MDTEINCVLLNELQLLLSMYDSTQIKFDDPELDNLINAFASGNNDNEIKPHLIELLNKSSVSFTMKFDNGDSKGLEIHFRIPNKYPSSNKEEQISATCSSRLLDSDFLLKLNTDLKKMINERYESTVSTENEDSAEDVNYCDILTIITYCQDYQSDCNQTGLSDQLENLGIQVGGNPTTAQKSSAGASSSIQNVPTKLARVWIHSHHIYNKKKRKFLIDNASELNLNGFSCPGKPGFICVEGDEDSCNEYWTRVRQLTWQKISLITKENLNNDNECVFNSFEELSCTKSDFIKMLEEKGISSVIKVYLCF